MSVEDGNGRPPGYPGSPPGIAPPPPFPFRPPQSFREQAGMGGGFGGGPGGGMGGGGFGGGGGGFGGNPGFRTPQQPFASPPSPGPSYSPLQDQQQQTLCLPDLLNLVRKWRPGKNLRTRGSERVLAPWFVLEVIDLEVNQQIYVHDPMETDEDPEKTTQAIEQRVEQRVRGLGDGNTRRFEVRCHFRTEDGVYSAWEPWTGNVTLPPQIPQWGQPHYGGAGLGGGGGGGGMGWGGGGGGMGGMGGGGMGGGMGGGGFGGPAHQSAVFLRQNIDAAQRSDTVLGRAITMYENIVFRLDQSNAYYVSQDMARMHAMAELNDRSRRNKLDEQMAELKMAAIQTALEKFLTALPMGFVVWNRWLQQKKADKEGKATPREQKATETLRKLMLELEKNPMLSQDPQMLRNVLKGAGATDETLDDMFATFQEFAFDRMMVEAEVKVKESILGMSNDGDANSGLKRLLRAAGVSKADDADAGNKAA